MPGGSYRGEMSVRATVPAAGSRGSSAFGSYSHCGRRQTIVQARFRWYPGTHQGDCMTPPPSLPSRRFFLKAAGVTLALPLLETLVPPVRGLALGSYAGAAVDAQRPVRMVCIGNML